MAKSHEHYIPARAKVEDIVNLAAELAAQLQLIDQLLRQATAFHGSQLLPPELDQLVNNARRELDVPISDLAYGRQANADALQGLSSVSAFREGLSRLDDW